MDEKQFLLEEKYAGVRSRDYEADCIRLTNGEPLAYVIGWVPFLDCKIFLDSRPLIPRPETEYWVEKAIKELSGSSFQVPALGNDRPMRILDLFAGSGAIGVAVLKHVPNVHVDFGEIDTAHFPTIRKNISACSTFEVEHARTKIIQTDVWGGISETYDFILTNPPYISRSRTGRIQDSVLKYEPKKALFAEEDGFGLVRKLIEGAKKHLNEKGILYIEHESEQTEMLQECATKAGFSVETHKDQYEVLRYSSLKAQS